MKAEPLSREEEMVFRRSLSTNLVQPTFVLRLLATLDREQQRAATAEGIVFAYQEKATDACVEIRDQHSFNSKSYNVADECADVVYRACGVAVAPLDKPPPAPTRKRRKKKVAASTTSRPRNFMVLDK